jgi:hypothetical protein
MTTQRSNEQIFARLFRMMDSPYEGEALSAFRQVRRILQEESVTFGAILEHTEHLRATNAALGQQNQELHQENVKFRKRFARFSLARAAATRVREFSARFTPDTSITVTRSVSRSPTAGGGIPRDVGSLIGIFAVIAVAAVSCQQFVSAGPTGHGALAAESPRLAYLATDVNLEGRAAAGSPQSPQIRWQASKLPADFSMAHPAWTRLPADFSVDHPPWCFACRGQQSHPRADRRRTYERVF